MGITLAVMGLLSFIGLELVLRAIGLHVPKDPYLSFGTVPDFFVQRTIEGKSYYQVAHRDVYSERQTVFAAKKDPNTMRIICIGASASAGWPHQGDEIYTVYLQKALERAYPGRQFEVLNLSAHAYAAYRVRLVFEEAILFEPDVVVIWSGNNEFLERRLYRNQPKWLEVLANLANESLAYRGLRGSRVGRWAWPDNTLSAYERGHHLYTMWSKLEQVAVTLRTEPEQFAAVQRHYMASLESMVATAERRGIPVVLATVPVNLRDWRPAVSCNSIDGAAKEHWQGRYLEGRRALAQREHADAVRLLSDAIALDPQYADAHFYLARAYEGKGDYARARGSFALARDYDCNPFRAISAFETTVRKIAGRHANVTVADLAGAFHAASAPYAPGFELFLDHVHPTRKGNVVAAETVFAALGGTGILGPNQTANPAATLNAQQVTQSTPPYDDWSDAPMQALLVRFYMAQHQDESIVSRARYLLQNPALAQQLSDADRTFLTSADRLFSEILAREAQWIEGRASDPRVRNKEQLLEFYKQTFEGYQEYKKKYGDAPH
ncbi:hypothetical protein YTPLAS18_13370 [Nitrospira sp.]|nr:hypothetical protein YTPLAS18_13370 [Nitrospira sp.]